MNRNRYTPTSRAWLMLLSVMYAVSLVVGAVGLGMATTFGEPQRVADILTSGENFTRLKTRLNEIVIEVADKEDVALPNKNYVPNETLQRAMRTGILISANFNEMPESNDGLALEFLTKSQKPGNVFTIAPLVTAIQEEVGATPEVKGNANRRKTLDDALKVRLNRTIQRDLMETGWGSAYPFLILTAQTAAIVGAILAVIQLFFMWRSAHSFQRFLKVFGRVTYLVGFAGGLSAMVAETQMFAGMLALGGIDTQTVHVMFAHFVPEWEKLAAFVVIVGLVCALFARALARLKPLPEEVPATTEASDTEGTKDLEQH